MSTPAALALPRGSAITRTLLLVPVIVPLCPRAGPLTSVTVTVWARAAVLNVTRNRCVPLSAVVKV